jgi:hypothetical protein
MTDKRHAQRVLAALLPKLPAEVAEALRPLLPNQRAPSRPQLGDALKKLETTNLESLRQVDLQVIARAACHIVGDSSTWVVAAKKDTLLSMPLHGTYHDALLELMLAGQ